MVAIRSEAAQWAPPRLSRRVFTDLAIWMSALGVLVGLAFPVALLTLGVSPQVSLRPLFFGCCVVAGMALAVANFGLVQRVVGVRVEQLSRQMRYVGSVIEESTFTGDWQRCSPKECRLPTDSDDQLGAAAAAFNRLVEALAASQEVQQVMSVLGRILAEHLDLAEFTTAVLGAFLGAGGAMAGAFCVVRDGSLELLAHSRLETGGLCENPTVLASLAADRPLVVDVPTGLTVDASLLCFHPRAVVSLPVRYRDVPLGIILLACTEAPTAQALRLLTAFGHPTGVALNNVLTHERFQRLAAVDPLTGAYNRRFGMGRLNEEWSRSVRNGTPLGLISFDIDHFKDVNDTFGHLAGDRVLREATARARAALREGDVLVRTGGEEFLVVLPGGGSEDVRSVGERIRRTISAGPIRTGVAEVAVSVSLGGVSLPHAGVDSPEHFLAAADQAMYSAKRTGRDQLTMHDGPMIAGTGSVAAAVPAAVPVR